MWHFATRAGSNTAATAGALVPRALHGDAGGAGDVPASGCFDAEPDGTENGDHANHRRQREETTRWDRKYNNAGLTPFVTPFGPDPL